MALNIELRDISSGRPVKPDFNPSIPREKAAKTIRRTFVKSARQLAQTNREFAQGTPLEIGSKASNIQRQFTAGEIDILA